MALGMFGTWMLAKGATLVVGEKLQRSATSIAIGMADNFEYMHLQ
jgi:hypothetical protein